jgi:hypothetical protein
MVNLYLHSNSIAGTVPSVMASMSSLTILRLQDNFLTGGVPSSLTALSNTLSVIYEVQRISPQNVALCDLCVATNLCVLTTVSGWGCTAGSPDSAACDWEGVTCDGGSTGSVTSLSLGSKGITGTIPISVGSLVNIITLYFQSNSITGSIPSSVGSLSNLATLYLYSNSIAGSIPSSMGSLVNLIILRLDSSSITGSIPSSVGSLTNL